MSEGLDFLSLHPFVRATVQDKVLGTIFGSALGDTVGLYTEFLPKTEAERCYPHRKFSLVHPITPRREDQHRDRFPPNAWTDDTDQSLLLLLSYLHNSTNPLPTLPSDFAARLRIWIEQGLLCLDRPPCGIGNLVGKVVKHTDYLTAPSRVARDAWIKTHRFVAPNGSLMRTHPLGVFCIGTPEVEAFRLAADVSLTTHTDPRCVVSCCISVSLIRGLLRGEILSETDLDACLRRAFDWVRSQPDLMNPGNDRSLSPEQVTALLDESEFAKHVRASTMEELELDDSQKMGYVYKCLGSAVLTLRRGIRATSGRGTDLFERLMTDLVMQGGDADTNAAAAGAFLGCWVGYSNLPGDWRDGLAHREWLMKKTERVMRVVGVTEVGGGGEGEGKDDGGKVDLDTAPDGGKGLLSKSQLEERERAFVTALLMKIQERKEAQERERQRGLGKGVGRWFKGAGLGGR
ncbi:ADP-ribosylglycohydrolase [Lepidopterella palustris CBS 459.81]|uniref:ADP-ribosylglycohydrolase n=1 Tax=Lepidopterella palustris CBS 459.81 TaxID=1314670 RepID=A0A8E2E3G8_9PEZI|nr:ADP-ribosylglycohydrolase [Lepidopterella palustris CBS 459.81]